MSINKKCSIQNPEASIAQAIAYLTEEEAKQREESLGRGKKDRYCQECNLTVLAHIDNVSCGTSLCPLKPDEEPFELY